MAKIFGFSEQFSLQETTKMGYFPKKSFYCINQGEYILKLQKNVNFEILATVPPFLRNENILGLGNPVPKSGTPDYVRSLKMLPIDFSSPKKQTLSSGFTAIFRFFRRNSTVDISCFTENLSHPTVFEISGCRLKHSTHN